MISLRNSAGSPETSRRLRTQQLQKGQPEHYIKRIIDASTQVPADTAVLLIYNMIAVKISPPASPVWAK
jgi:hypothetical protein